MSVIDKEANILQQFESILFILFYRIENLFLLQVFVAQIKAGKMNQRKQFYASEETASEILRQLDEDVDSDTELEENEISGEANIVLLLLLLLLLLIK